MQSDMRLIKIGRSSNPERRCRDLQNTSGMNIRLICVFEGKGADERSVLCALDQYRRNGEWVTDCEGARAVIVGILGEMDFAFDLEPKETKGRREARLVFEQIAAEIRAAPAKRGRISRAGIADLLRQTSLRGSDA
jgi:hypothetical protein